VLHGTANLHYVMLGVVEKGELRNWKVLVAKPVHLL